MFSTNGALVLHRPLNRVAMCFRTADHLAELEDERREQAAQDESEAQQLAHEMQARVSAAKRAATKYRAAMKVIGDLLAERRAIDEDNQLPEGERVVQLTAIDRTIAEHRAAMIGCMREFVGDDADVESAVSKDLASLTDEAGDRRGLHARHQQRDDRGRFDGE